MKKLAKTNRRSAKLFVVLALAVCFVLSSTLIALSYVTPTWADENTPATRDTSHRVTMLDLMARYGSINYVLGPVDVLSDTPGENGQYKYKDTNLQRDAQGNPVRDTCTNIDSCTHQAATVNGVRYLTTNNIYGIAADRYFNVESYIHAPSESDGRTLYGWAPDIEGILSYKNPTTGKIEFKNPTKIAEDGRIMQRDDGGTYKYVADAKVGIRVTYLGTEIGTTGTYRPEKTFGTTETYAMIVPSDITAVGKGSAAFVYNGKSYYAKTGSVNEYAEGPTAEFTDFGSFIYDTNLIYTNGKFNVNYWCPRERLEGVFFPEDSRLKSIADGIAITATRTTKELSGKSAFATCSGLRFMILPGAKDEVTTGVQTIGAYAFVNCSSIVDTNIPNSVDTVGASAYQDCSSIKHISIPAAKTFGANAFPTGTIKHADGATGATNVGLSEKNSTLFVMANKPVNGVLDTGAFNFEYNGSTLSAVSIAGATGEDASRVFAFPEAKDFNNDADNVRRQGVAYDYLDCDGKTVNVTLPFTAEQLKTLKYSIASKFADQTWCQNVVIPKDVTSIGSNAFYNSHVKYLELYSAIFNEEGKKTPITIGSNAFAEAGATGIQGWLYVHQVPGADGYTSNESLKGHFNNHTSWTVVYENYDLCQAFNFEKPSGISGNGLVYYQVPLVAHVNNADSQTFGFKYGDMMANHYNDYDYVENVEIGRGANDNLIYAKKLVNPNAASGTGTDFAEIKSSIGVWVPSKNGEILSDFCMQQSQPTLSNMESTIWYDDSDMSSKDTVKTTAKELFENAVKPVKQIDIYTKIVARPENIKDGTYAGIADQLQDGKYVFGKEYTFKGSVKGMLGDNSGIDFYHVLGLSEDDYLITCTNFSYAANSSTNVSNVTVMQNAGTYTFTVGLNKKNWGEWSQDYLDNNAEYFNATVTVEQKQLDYTTIGKIPQFVAADTDTEGNVVDGNALFGNITPLYYYQGAWYTALENGQEAADTRTVTNSYVYAAGKKVSIKMAGEKIDKASEEGQESNSSKLGDVLISRYGCSGTVSGANIATFEFSVKTIPDTSYSNYIFYYGDDDNTKYNTVSDDDAGLRMYAKQDGSFRVIKQWYIVVETNMFTLGDHASPYAPLTTDKLTYQDVINVQLPSLRKGDTAISFEFYFNGNALTGIDKDRPTLTGDTSLAYFINSSMPAGAYTLKLFAGAVTVTENGVTKQYPSISGKYDFTVLPREFDSATIADLHNALRGTLDPNAPANATELQKYINAYPLVTVGNQLRGKLHADTDSIVNTLKTKLGGPAEGTYWKENKDCAVYFATAVAVDYNLEGSGNTVYVDYATMQSMVAAAGTYTLYYRVSALNFKTVGGADAPDRQARGFRTTLYTDMKITDIAQKVLDQTSPYFHDVIYTGAPVYTSVDTNRYYRYSFGDSKNYINVGKATVMLELYDSDLARWNMDLSGAGFTDDQIAELTARFSLSADKRILTFTFNILPAENSWDVAPQMPSWTFNAFDSAINTVAASPHFASGVTYYLVSSTTKDGNTVYSYLKNDGKTLVEFTGTVAGMFDNNQIPADAFTFTVDENGVIVDSNGASRVLNALKPGSYYLASVIAGVDNPNADANDANTAYNVKPHETIGDRRNLLVISQAVNRWTSTPNIIRWQWGSFNPSVNTITATSLYPTTKPYEGFVYDTTPQVHFAIVELVLENGEYVEKAITGLSDFTSLTDYVDSSKTTTVADLLSRLPAGSYRLKTSLAETAYYHEIPSSGMDFNISQATNVWTTSPNVIRWQWGSYNKEVNLINAVAKYSSAYVGETAPVVKYTVLDSNYAKINDVLVNFTVTDGVVDTPVIDGVTVDVAAALAALNAGTYYIVASFAGTRNYLPINEGAIVGADGSEYKFDNVGTNEKLNPVMFKVDVASNSWTVEPGITSWQYGNFTAGSNFIAGTPYYPSENKVVIYGIRDTTPNSDEHVDPSTIAGKYLCVFNSMSDNVTVNGKEMTVEAYLKTLPAKSTYYFVAYVGGADNQYEYMFMSTTFSVTRLAENSWQDGKEPSVQNWTYGQFADSFITAGAPAVGDADASKFILQQNTDPSKPNDFTAVDDYDVNGMTLSALLDALKGDKKLSAGNYRLIVKADSTENYVGAPNRELRFTVAKANNEWAGTARPSINSWTFGDKTVPAPTIVSAQYDNAAVTYVIYKATMRGSVWVKANDEPVYTYNPSARISSLADLLAGDYLLETTAASTVNYNELSELTYFNVAKFNNSWATEPEGTLQWTWGRAGEYLISKNFINAVAKMGSDAHDVTYEITLINADGSRTPIGTFIKTGENGISAKLIGLCAGDYEIVVTAPAADTDSYTSVTKTCYVTVSRATFTWNSEPTDGGWIYDDADSLKNLFGAPSVNKALDTDVATITYTISGILENGELKKYTDYDVMKGVALGLGAGNHTITVTVTNPNYETLTKQVTITVDAATFTWESGHAPADTDWFWNENWVSTDGGRNIVEPKARDHKDAAADVKLLLKVSETEQYTTYANILTYLQSNKRNAGDYTVTVTVARDNYTTISTSFTVKIKQATNKWLDGKKPHSKLEKEYLADLNLTDIIFGEAKFGTVTVTAIDKDGNKTPIADANALLTWINEQSKGEHKITTSVAANGSNYNELTATTTLTVKGKSSTWDNQNALKETIEFTYGTLNAFASVIIPHKTDPSGVTGTLTYEVLYAPYIGDSIRPVFKFDDPVNAGKTKWKVVEEWLTDPSRGAGTYTIKATYDPNDPNYENLSYTVEVTVNRAAISWTTYPENLYNRAFEDFGNVPTPSVNIGSGHLVKYVVSGDKSETFTSNSEFNLAVYLNGLSVGAYTIKYSIDETNNYLGLAESTFNVTIYMAANSWNDPSVLKDTMTVYRGGNYEFVLPTALRGKVVVTVTAPGAIASDGYTENYTNDAFNNWLKNKNYAANDGAYKVTFKVEGTPNYNGLQYDTSLYIRKNPNSWVTGKAPADSYSWAANAANRGTEFAIPEATTQKITNGENVIDLLRFDITKVNDNTYGTNGTKTVDADGLLAELKNLKVGTYTVTSRIGSLVDVDPDKGIRDYNADYEYLSGTTTVIVSLSDNSFTSGLVNNSWTYGDSSEIAALIEQLEKLAVQHGANTIVYTISGTDANGNKVSKTFNTANNNPNTDPDIYYNAFEKFTAAIQALNAGTYTVTASVDANEQYAGATTSAVYTVSKVTTAWTLTKDKLDEYRQNGVSFEWKADGSYSQSKLPAMTVANYNGVTITYAINGAPVTDWISGLKNRNAGTYRLSASVTGDVNHTDLSFEFTVTITPVTTSWSNQDYLNNNKSVSWTYNPDGTLALNAPVLVGWDQSNVIYTVTNAANNSQIALDDTATSTSDWGKVTAAIVKQDCGSYVIRATVNDKNGNHTSLSHEMTVTVNPADNTWVRSIVTDSTKEKDKDKISWTYGSKELDVEYQAAHNNNLLKITVNGSSVSVDVEELNKYLNGLPYGTYTIVASVAADGNYKALSETVMLTVNRASNSWTTPIAIGTDGRTGADGNVPAHDAHGWVWNKGEVIKSIVTIPVSAVGDRVTLVVKSGSTAVLSMEIRYDDQNGSRVPVENDVNAFLTNLFALDAGNYVISASVAETPSYSALQSDNVEFEVKKAKNTWTELPSIGTLAFGTNVPVPKSQAAFGAVEKYQYAYAVKDGVNIAITDVTEWLEFAPAAAGSYYVRGEISGTVNYSELTFNAGDENQGGWSPYTIGAGANDWVNMPGVIAWTWNSYSRTINLFSGSARSNGKVTFGIYKGTNDNRIPLQGGSVGDFVNFGGVTITSEQARKLDAFNLVSDTPKGKAVYVPTEIVTILNALKPGTYLLTVDVEAGESLKAMSGYTTFTVGKAANRWTTAPNVMSYVYGSYVADGDRATFTAGQSKYGSVVNYRIVGDATTSDVMTTTDAVETYLRGLAAGNYALQAWVNGGDTYDEFYTSNAPYSVLFSVTRAQNGWVKDHAPQDSVSKNYTELQAVKDIADIFAMPQPLSGNEGTITFAILDSAGNTVNGYSEVAYDGLLAALQSLGFGSYFIQTNVEQSGKYFALTANTPLTITRLTNSYEGTVPSSVDVTWIDKDRNDLTSLTAITSQHGTVKYVLDGTSYTFDGLKGELNKKAVGTYNVTVSVDGENAFEGCPETVIVVNVLPATNVWENDWTLANSIKQDGKVVTEWNWSSAIVWTGVTTKYGTTVNVMISSVADPSNAINYFTIDTANKLDEQVATVSAAISALNFGSYRLTVTAPADANWKAIEGNGTVLEFSVNQDGNDWTVAPEFVDSQDKPHANAIWSYNTAARANAKAKHGDFTVEYFVSNNGSKGAKLAQMPANAGKYIAVFSVEETDNYAGKSSELSFEITKISYKEYSVVPNSVSWTWGEKDIESFNRYDRTIHLFVGASLSGGIVRYSITKDGSVVTVNGTKLENIELVDAQGVRHNDPTKDLFVPEQTAELIAQLLAGQYKLVVSFGETDNFLPFESEVNLTVAAARNEWTTTPRVATWSVNSWKAAADGKPNNTPQAASLFGKPTITITGATDNIVYYRSVAGKEEINLLNRAPAGWYNMLAVVSAEEGKYENALSTPISFQVFVQGSATESNAWAVAPSIMPWVANLNGQYGLITGTPIRGLPYFEFYNAVFENGEWKMVGKAIGESVDSVKVPAGTQYYKDFYVPMKDGNYVMVAYAVYEANGTVVGTDTLSTWDTPFPFEIYSRPNSFDQDIRMATLLYLGEKDTWAYPVAKAALAGSTYEYSFYKLEDDNVTYKFIGKDIALPTDPGKYKVIATASATYSDPLAGADFLFEVKKSPNSWVNDKSPTINGWSEEDVDNIPDPEGAAKFGTVTYEYYNVKTPDIKLTEKPTLEGDYVMIATVDHPDYEKMVSTYEFSIGPAYDHTFLVVDLVLGFVACALAVVVIIFAVRRYKENG